MVKKCLRGILKPFLTNLQLRPMSAAERFERIVNSIDFNDENIGVKDSKDDGEINANKIPEKIWKLLREQIRYAEYNPEC